MDRIGGMFNHGRLVASLEVHPMSHAEYFSRPFPLVAKLASLLRNNAAVQFVVARFAGLLRGNKGSDEPLVSPFLGETPGVEETPGLDEIPSLGEMPKSW